MSEKKEEKKYKKITKELLFSLTNKREKVEIEGFNGDIFVKIMSGEERRLFHQKMAADKTKDVNDAPTTMMPTLIALCTVDKDNDNMFGTDDADIKEIDKRLPSTVQEKIFGLAAVLNGLTQKTLDESVKN